jgi:hypothetical protein
MDEEIEIDPLLSPSPFDVGLLRLDIDRHWF